MNKLPIYSLEEDFRALGLLSEDILDEDSVDEAFFPAHLVGTPLTPAEKKAMVTRRKASETRTGRRGQKMGGRSLPVKGKKGMKYKEDSDLTDEERAQLDELRLVRRKKLRGVKALKARKRSKMFYKAHRAKYKKMRKGAKAKRRRKLLAKMPKARRGYIRRTNIESNDALGNIGGVLVSLGSNTPNGAPLQDAYMNIVRQASNVRKGYAALAEEYVSTTVDFGDVSEAARGIAAEAALMAEALAEHDKIISVSDQTLMDEHVDTLIEELDDLAAMLAETQAAVDLAEGLDEDEDLDDDSLDEMGYPPMNDAWGGTEAIPPTGSTEPYKGGSLDHGEHPMKPIHGHGDGPFDATFEVMHPLGISRVDHREKLVLKSQLSRETTEDEDFEDDSLFEDVD